MMFRKICVLSFLLILVASTALNAAKPEKQKSSSQKEKSRLYPIHCIQNWWLDYPGDGDVYQSVKLEENCGSPPIEELWYGVPAREEYPEDCDQCEGNDDRLVGGEGPLPAHKNHTLNRERAWSLLVGGLEAAKIGTSGKKWHCHVIPKAALAGLARDLPIVTIALDPPAGGIVKEVRYLGIETEALPHGQLEEATFSNVAKRDGQQLWIEYTVGSEQHKGYVWLKAPIEEEN